MFKTICRRILDVVGIDGGARIDYSGASVCTKDIQSIKEMLASILNDNILSFWYPNVIDERNGGYRLNCDIKGIWSESSRKNLIGQARTLWFFSKISQTKYAEEKYRVAADFGYNFLKEFWDHEYGGFYWEIDAADRKPTRARKHVCGQIFALYALCEYARCTSEPTALHLADDLFKLLERYAHDKDHGGYYEFFDVDWGEMGEEETPYLGPSPMVKTFNVHIHLIEAFTEYYRLTKNPLAAKRLKELVSVFQNKIVDYNSGTSLNHFTKSWEPVRGGLNERVNYGHDLENLWLVLEAFRTLEIPVGPHVSLCQKTFAYTVKYGYDTRRGGIYDHGLIHQKANARSKVWWPQAEALVAALEMYRLTREEKYINFFHRTLGWIVRHQIDWKAGEWHQRITRWGTIKGEKAESWKTPYHNGRAMIRCLELLDEFR